MQNVIELLRRWAELEPGRCSFDERTDGSVIVIADRDHRFTVVQLNEENQIKSVGDGWTLCGAIEAAIQEREDWQLELKGDFRGWEIRIWVRNVTRPVSAPTKLEALLAAYVQALEATR